MKNASLGLVNTFKDDRSRSTFFISFVLLFLSYFLLTNGANAVQVLSFSSLSFFTRVHVFLLAFFDSTELLSPGILFLVVGVVVMASLTITMFRLLMRIRKQALVSSGFVTGFALFLATLGVGCAACGAVVLGSVLSFFGLGGLLVYFPYHGVEIGYIGLLLLVIISYTLAKRLANPYTC